MAFNPKYTHLFFDLDNTLWDFDFNAKVAMKETLANIKLENQIEDFDRFYDDYDRINSQLWEAYRNRQIKKSDLITKRFSDTLKAYQIRGVDPIAMNELYLDLMGQQTKLVDGARPVLEELHKRNFRLQIITNGFRDVQHRKLVNSGIAHLFQQVFCSEEVQFAKPDPRIFSHAIRSSNAKKQKSIMIGDNWEIDIIGARTFGIDQVFLKTNTIPDTPPTKNTPMPVDFDNSTTNTTLQQTFCVEKLTNILLIV
ncbi:YjjG family noncanonical pyrimidine nucleotidase [Mangrovibacterium sp.]|uniref:YjjG family noncanonical pyrimidine nucleotidase n=1 Tax=Mangrovibacterium sp. TaxID=1961364 RepID=UPI0035667D9F